jgi:hypothetical protein
VNSAVNSPWLEFKTAVIIQYQEQKQMADAALARVDDAAFFARLHEGPDAHTNSIAILLKHLSGNFLSRWTDFLTSDGEKPGREFLHETGDERSQIMQRWEEGWRVLFAALDALTAADFAQTVYIRDEPHSVVQAILRNLLHTTHHIGQIDLLAPALQRENKDAPV